MSNLVDFLLFDIDDYVHIINFQIYYPFFLIRSQAKWAHLYFLFEVPGSVRLLGICWGNIFNEQGEFLLSRGRPELKARIQQN